MKKKEAERKLRDLVRYLGAEPTKIVIGWTNWLPDARGMTFLDEGLAYVMLENGADEATLRHEAYHAAFQLLRIEENLAESFEAGLDKP